MTVTRCRSTASPATVNAQFPPCSAAKSTTTPPLGIDATMSAVMSFGAGLPGTNAVVMMMSTSRACCANSAISALRNSALITLA